MNDDNETPMILLCMRTTEDDHLETSLRAHEHIDKMPAELLRDGIIGWIHCLEQMLDDMQMLDDILGRNDTVH